MLWSNSSASVRLRIEQLVAAFSLRVSRILDLDPVRGRLLGRSIGGRLPLRHNALQVEFADLLEELPATCFDVIHVKHGDRLRRSSCLKPRFPLDQWQLSQVFAVQEEQVEGEDDRLASAEQQVIEHRTARVIDAGDLAIEDSIFDPKVVTDPLRQSLEVAERIPVP